MKNKNEKKLSSISTLKVEISPVVVAFSCEICGGLQPCGYWDTIIFPVCDKCKSDLKEFVLSKRQKHD